MKRKHTHSLVTWALARLLWPCYSCLFILFNNIQLRINWNIKLQPTARVNAFPSIQSTASKLDVGLQFVCWGSDAFWFWFWFGSGSKLSPTLMAGFRFSSLYSTFNYCTAPGRLSGFKPVVLNRPDLKLSFQLKPPQVMSEAVMYSKVSSEMTSMTGHTTAFLISDHCHSDPPHNWVQWCGSVRIRIQDLEILHITCIRIWIQGKKL